MHLVHEYERTTSERFPKAEVPLPVARVARNHNTRLPVEVQVLTADDPPLGVVHFSDDGVLCQVLKPLVLHGLFEPVQYTAAGGLFGVPSKGADDAIRPVCGAEQTVRIVVGDAVAHRKVVMGKPGGFP
eukprot:CAMPEP_0185763058 /NCGR_PEP_ID=MMETSP1174-20130828/22012_1 /TAXON_ID=35687 /ORGANISM="Dictyocha speculum, Strain CCMP1381" /LENGTH=128 /DNA_ID=CAMNT_0028444999 /DNA_START=435 /DNA_END=817 /DNA_ORIENTATION=-